MADFENLRRKRIPLIFAAIFIAMCVIVLRMGYLQIVKGAAFRSHVGTTLFAHVAVLPQRGWIYDANKHLLAYDKPMFSIVMTRQSSLTRPYQRMAQELAPVLSISASELLARMVKHHPGETQVKIFEHATMRQIAYVYEHADTLPGVSCMEDSQRIYPQGDVAGHVVGYIGSQPQSQVDTFRQRGYTPDEQVGIAGVEKSYETALQGRPGYRVWQINHCGVPLREVGIDPPPVAGHSIQLTIDSKLQAIAQSLVTTSVQSAHRKSELHATDAEAVMIDTRTGAILALVSYPFYNPNWFVSQKDYAAHARYINNPSLTPEVNHVLASPRYPGSTVKPINVLAGLETGAINRNTWIIDDGKVMVGTYEAHDWKRGGHGLVAPRSAIQKSCDTFMYDLGMWMANWHDGPPLGKSVALWNQTDRVQGYDTLFAWERKFGLGQLTGIDLPGENAGHFYMDESIHHTIVRYHLDAAIQIMRQTGRVPNRGLLYDNAFAAIGQMQEFTPLQLAVAAMTIADNGSRLAPHVVSRILSQDGHQVQYEVKARVVERVPLSRANLRLVQGGMYDAVNRFGGTAYGGFYGSRYEAAGKTGTAEVTQQGVATTISLFMGYAPFDHPQVSIAVMVPGGGESSDVAVPLARQLLDAYFRLHPQ